LTLVHVAAFRLRPEVTEAEVEELHAALSRLPQVIDGIREFACGRDAGLREGNAGYGVVAWFDDEDAWRLYQTHPEHQRVISDVLAPLLEDRVALQFRQT
jgi:heme-degrading monooxygenase HmoA